MPIRTQRLGYALAFALSALVSFRGFAEEESPLKKAKKDIGLLVPLNLQDGRLHLNTEAWNLVSRTAEEDSHKYSSMYCVDFTEVILFNRILFSCQHSSYSGGSIEYSVSREGENLSGTISFLDKVRKVELKEGMAREFSLAADPDGQLTLKIFSGTAAHAALLVQTPKDGIRLMIVRGYNPLVLFLRAKSFDDLLKQAPDQIQLGFIRPLAEIGIQMPPSPNLPAVMARATSGYSDPPFEIARQVAPAIRQLSLDDADARDAATLDLIKLFPLAVKQITDAAASTPDRETELRLRRVIAAHPGIAKFKEYVEAEKLQENKAYLLDLFTNVKFFKESARQRLIAVYGHDYGNDPANWPRP